MSILEQVKRPRMVRAALASIREETDGASETVLPDVPSAGPANIPPPTPALNIRSYGIQPATFEAAAGTESPEWITAVNRTLRLQAQRRDAHEDLKSRIHEDLIGEL